MTLEEYTAKRNEYLRKIENYKRKLDKLDEKFFWQMNKDNKFLQKIGYFGLDQKGGATE